VSNIKYKQSKASEDSEKLISDPLIAEHNIIGARFKNKEITSEEWVAFQEEWKKRFKKAMHQAIKNRVYVEDIVDGN